MKTQMAFMLSSPQVRLYQEQVIEPQIRELRNKLSIAEKALEFYGHVNHYRLWDGEILKLDKGKQAREALAEIRGEKKLCL